MFNEILKQLLPGLETVLAALGSLLLAYAAKFIAAHARNATVAGIMTRLVDLTSVVVAEAEQTVVAKIATDEPMSPEKARAVRDAVVAKLKAHLGPQGLAELKNVVRPEDLEALLVSQIEAEVAKQKAFGPIDVPPVTLTTAAAVSP